MLDFDACGVEIEAELVEAAQQLADDFELPVQFVQGSFVPKGAALDLKDGFAWLRCESDSALEELGLEPEDFGMIFSYPWPDEENAVADLFQRYARVGAVLVTYHGGDAFRVRRKTAPRSRRLPVAGATYNTCNEASRH
jgi:hypothetical protein